MGLADANGADQQHAGVIGWVFADKALRHHQRLGLTALVRARQDVVVGKFAVLVPLRDAGAVEQLLGVMLALAVAARDAAFATVANGLPTRVVARGANLGRGIHRESSVL